MSTIYLPHGIEARITNPTDLDRADTTFNEVVFDCRNRAGRLILAQKLMPGQPIQDQIQFMDAKHPFRDVGTWHDIRVAVDPVFLEPFFKALENFSGLSMKKILEETPGLRLTLSNADFDSSCVQQSMIFENGTITSRQFVRSRDLPSDVVKRTIKLLHCELGTSRYESEFISNHHGTYIHNPKYPHSYPPEPGFGKGFKTGLQRTFWRALWEHCVISRFTHVQQQYIRQAHVLGEFKYTDRVPDFVNGGWGSFMIHAPVGTKDSFTYDGKDVWALHVNWKDFREGRLELLPWMDADPAVQVPATESQPVLPDQPDQTSTNPDLANPEE